MKQKILYLIISLLFSSKLLSQDQSVHLNVNLFIDEKFVIGGVYDGYVYYYNDSNTNVIDSIKFQYEAGDMIMSSNAYDKLLLLHKKSKITIKFKYIQVCPERVIFNYKIEWEGTLLSYRFIIFNIYNFSNKSNYGTFWERNGYGIEVQIPSYSTILPRKKPKKNTKINCK